MQKFHTIEFSTDNMSAEEIKARASELIDKAIAEDKKEVKHLEEIIKSFISFTKIIVGNNEFSKDADNFASHLLKQDNQSKRSFVTCYVKSVEETIDDISHLVSDYKEISQDNEKVNEKKKNNNKKQELLKGNSTQRKKR